MNASEYLILLGTQYGIKCRVLTTVLEGELRLSLFSSTLLILIACSSLCLEVRTFQYIISDPRQSFSY